MTDLGTLGGATSTAYGINNQGVIVGYSYNNAGDFLGFVYQNGTMTALGTLGGSWSIAYAINDENQITGQAYTRGNRTAHAFRYTNGKWQTWARSADRIRMGRPSITAERSWVFRLFAMPPTTHLSPLTGRKMQDLNKMIPVRAGWVLQEGAGINDSGQIAGYGTLQGELHAFLLTPAAIGKVERERDRLGFFSSRELNGGRIV